MRPLLLAAALALAPTLAAGQVLGFPPPGPGTPVEFVTCPELTGNGFWIARDALTGTVVSLEGAPPPPPNRVIRVSGIISPVVPSFPGWLLTPIRVVVGEQVCRSIGVPLPWRRDVFPLFPFVSNPFASPAPVVQPLPPAVRKY